MATDRQIEANRRNAALSSGPKTEQGKARSRANATKHGMAGESAEVEAGLSSEFQERRAKWAVEHNPVGETAGWALDRVVAASLRIERCEHALDQITTTVQQRALLAWDQDRAVEAATILGRLSRDPVLASCQLQASLAGVNLLVEAWLVLVAALENGEDWSEAEASKALDLLGVAVDLRSGRTPIDDPEGGDPVVFRRQLAFEEVDRLEEFRDEALIPLDAIERRQAMAGHLALLSKPAKLVLRYERDAWKRYRESLKEVKSAPSVVVDPPTATSPAVGPPTPSIEESSPLQPGSMELVEESDWLDALEPRTEGLFSRPGSYIPMALGAGAAG